jgi:type IV secretion system protein VirB6
VRTKYLAYVASIDSARANDSTTLQQGDIAILLTTMVLSVPPMIAASFYGAFFQGTLGQFNSYSPFGNAGAAGGGGGGYVPLGTPSYSLPPPNQNAPEQHANSSGFSTNSANQSAGSGSSYTPQPDKVKVQPAPKDTQVK